jgi:hypothetical protein
MTEQDNTKQPQDQDAAQPERKETTHDAYMKASLSNPNMRPAKSSGTGFVIGGQKP